MNLSLNLLISLSVLSTVLCADYFFGHHTPDTRLINREKVQYSPFPWRKRVKLYSYDDMSQRIIRAINCYDYQHTEAKVTVVAGGVGFTFVMLRLKSQRSYPLEYAIEIYA